MTCCCCPSTKGTNRLFSWLAGRHRRRYANKGFDTAQHQLLTAIEAADITDSTLLEIGCGVGHLHQTLLEKGARRAIGIDIAAKMLAEATELAEQRDLSERTDYLEGDFVQLADDLAQSDVTILDKVVCCYPDADNLVRRSLAKTRRVYALTYPRKCWYTKLFVQFGNALMWAGRSEHRSFVHDPALITGWIKAAGFQPRQLTTTWFWRTEVYERQA